MFFNSPEYVAFFAILFVAFSLTNRWKMLLLRNMILLLGSYYFYAQLHVWFVLLLLYTTSVNYVCGRWIENNLKRGEGAKMAVSVAIILSLSILVIFKYAYIYDSSILLPVGLSFFTFQALTYSIDIYRGRIIAEKNPLMKVRWSVTV